MKVRNAAVELAIASSKHKGTTTMTLVEAYHEARRIERAAAAQAGAADRLQLRTPSVNHAVLVGALGCMWAAAFTIKLSWFMS